MLYNPRCGVRGDELIENRDFNEDLFECLLDLLKALAESEKWDHVDGYRDGIQRVTRDDEMRSALEFWCEENLIFWNDAEFNQ